MRLCILAAPANTCLNMSQFIIFIGQQWMLVSLLAVLVFLYVRLEIKRGGENISVHQLTHLVNRENALVLDVREHSEFNEGHLVDAINIPFSKITERLHELDKHKTQPIIIIDKMGQHSGTVGRQLLEAGFRAMRLEGGMTEWRGSNLPLVRKD